MSAEYDALRNRIALASQLAATERHIADMGVLGLKSPDSAESLATLRKHVEGDELITALLPQIRECVTSRHRRVLFLNDCTFLGLLRQAIAAQQMIIDGKIVGTNELPELAYAGGKNREAWTQFQRGLLNGSANEIVSALNTLITNAFLDMIDADLPPTKSINFGITTHLEATLTAKTSA